MKIQLCVLFLFVISGCFRNQKIEDTFYFCAEDCERNKEHLTEKEYRDCMRNLKSGDECEWNAP